MTNVDDIVLLVPGFLGFDHFGGFPYFSQAAAAAIRVALEIELEKTAPSATFKIEPLTTVPAGSLEERQEHLSQQIVELLRELGSLESPPRIHLVGHSTGGVDAELLVRSRTVSGRAWTKDEEAIRRAVRSVIGLAVPVAGSGLATSPLGELLATGPTVSLFQPSQLWKMVRAKFKGVTDLLQVLGAVFALGPQNAAVSQLAAGGLDDLHPLLRFVESLLTDKKLLHDLRPDVTPTLMSRAGAVDTGHSTPPAIRRYVTIAVDAPTPSPTGRLFDVLHRMCAGGLRGNADARVGAAALQKRIDAKAFRIIGARPVPPISEEASDGVVNTTLQIPFGTPAELEEALDHVVAIVVADHLDVVGGFPMTDQVSTKKTEANGFLNSGSKFRAPEFSKLYRSIASDIAVAAHGVPKAAPALAVAGTLPGLGAGQAPGKAAGRAAGPVEAPEATPATAASSPARSTAKKRRNR